MLAYRLWTRPDFPTTLFYTGGGVDRGVLPPMLQGLEPVALDPLADPEVKGQLQSRFSTLESSEEDRYAESLIAPLTRLLAKSPDGTSVSGVDPRINAILSSGIQALPWDSVMTSLDSSERQELLELVAALSFPPEPLRSLQEVNADDSLNRAFFVDSLPSGAARALIRRAWGGRPPPGTVTLQSGDWQGTVSGVIDRVCETVGRATSYNVTESRHIVQQSRALYFVIFASQPVLSSSLIEQVLEALPGALLLFPGDSQRSIPESYNLVQLTPFTREAASTFAVAFDAMTKAALSPSTPVSNPVRPRKKVVKKVMRKSQKKK
jgi:hypothetical protein